jgi:hypothetical protein
MEIGLEWKTTKNDGVSYERRAEIGTVVFDICKSGRASGGGWTGVWINGNMVDRKFSKPTIAQLYCEGYALAMLHMAMIDGSKGEKGN